MTNKDYPYGDEPDLAQIRMDELAFDRQERIKAIMDAAAGHEAGDIVEVPEKRVVTYTRMYRMETSLTDEEIVAWAQLSTPEPIDDLNDALERLSLLHDHFGQNEPEDKVRVELHNTQVEERDPGFF